MSESRESARETQAGQSDSVEVTGIMLSRIHKEEGPGELRALGVRNWWTGNGRCEWPVTGPDHWPAERAWWRGEL